MKIKLFVAYIVALLASVSCQPVDPSIPSVLSKDPEGTITANIMLGGDYLNLTINGRLYVYLRKDYNIYPSGAYVSMIKTVGVANSLGSLNTSTVPDAGWGGKAAIEQNTLYILRFENDNSYTYFGLYVSDSIIDTSNGVMGYTLKFCQFVPGEGWI